MQFEKNNIYHIYNQGNNRQMIFFSHENYLFFLKKMRDFVKPYGDFLCYCLMPNHFHWLFYVRSTELPGNNAGSTRTLNDSIGILLRSYTRAINKQEGRTGALFREKTKAKNGWEPALNTLIRPRFEHIACNWHDYGSTAFHYIHNNPVKSGLVSCPEDWLYSSALDYAEKRDGTLCNKALAREMLFLGR